MAWFQKKNDAPAAPAKPATPGKTVKIAPLLSPEVVLFPAAGTDKNAILASLAAAICAKAGLPGRAEAFLAKVQEREQGISTTLDTGLSLPHARVDGIDGILAGMAVLGTPLPDPKQADLPIRVVFLFFSPNKPEAFPLHLQLLRGVSSLFQPALIDRLTAASGPAAACELVKTLEG